MSKEKKLKLADLGMPKPQLNDRSALCLLALLNLSAKQPWKNSTSPLMGITPIMEWVEKHYEVKYAPNTRETFRRQSMHQFIEAGIALYNPDKPERPVNSPAAVYQIEPNLLNVLKEFGSSEYKERLRNYCKERASLVKQYAKERAMHLVPIKLKSKQHITLSSGEHSVLIKSIVEEFLPRYVPNGELIYVGDTGSKFGYYDKELLGKLGIILDSHGKMPDVIIYYREKNWLVLVESVTSHGAVDYKRHRELGKLFAFCTAGLVYVSAFPNRNIFLKYLESIAWETEVWIADAPTHMIHFNGSRFLGPYT